MEQWKKNLYTLWVTQVLSLMGFGLGVPFIPFFFQEELGVVDPVLLNYHIGLAASLPAVTMAFAAPIWGMLGDRYGRKFMILRAMMAAAILISAMGLTTELWQFQLLRGLQGIFTGTVTASMAFIAANTPDHKISHAMGFITSSNFLGYSLGPVLGGLLAEQLGYRACFFAGGAVMTAGLLLMVVVVKEDPDSFGPRAKSKDTTERGSEKLLTPLILSLLAMLFLSKVYTTVFMPFVPLFVEETLGTREGAATLTGILGGVTSFAISLSAITLTRLGDRFGKIKTLWFLILAILPISLLLPVPSTILPFLLLLFVFYFISGAVEPLLTALASEQINPSVRGALFGWIGTIASVGFMVSPLIGATMSAKMGPGSILWLIPGFILIQLFLIRFLMKQKGVTP